jgi:hypothetical protein
VQLSVLLGGKSALDAVIYESHQACGYNDTVFLLVKFLRFVLVLLTQQCRNQSVGSRLK